MMQTVCAWLILTSYMMTWSNGNVFRVTGPLCGEFTAPRWIPRLKASDAEPWCFFDLGPNKRLSKQSIRRWFETPSRQLWRHSQVCDSQGPLSWTEINQTITEYMACLSKMSSSKGGVWLLIQLPWRFSGTTIAITAVISITRVWGWGISCQKTYSFNKNDNACQTHVQLVELFF